MAYAFRALASLLVCVGCGCDGASTGGAPSIQELGPPYGSLVVLEHSDTVLGVVGAPGSWQVVKGGEAVGERYALVGRPVPQPGGDSVAFRAKSGDHWVVIRDGARMGAEYAWVSDPVFSPDGGSIACAARVGGEKMVLVKNGEAVSEPYDDIISFAWASSGASLVAAVRSGGKGFVVKDGRRLSEDSDGVADLRVTPEGHVFFRAWTYRPGGSDSWQVMKDGVPVGPPCEHILSLVLSPDGRSYAFSAWESGVSFVIRDGEMVGDKYEGGVGTPVFSPDGRSLAFAAASGTSWFLVLNGTQVSEYYEEIPLPVFSPDSRSVAFLGLRGGQWYPVRVGEGVARGTGCAADAVRPPVWSRDGRSFAFAARRGGRWFVMKEGRRVGGEFDDVSDIITAADGSLVFAGRKGKRLHRVSEPW